MSMTVVGLYRTEDEVRRVIDDLTRNDFPRGGITRHDEANEGLQRWLEAQGVPEGEVEEYVEGVRNGGHLIALEASDERSPDAVAIMRRHERDLDAGAAGTTGAAVATGAAGAVGATDPATRTTADDARLRGDAEDDAPARAGDRYVFDDDRDHFRTHHRENFANSEYGYEDYEPAYRYGADLWNHPDYGGSDWNTISGTARDRWERQNAGTWTEFEPAVRYGYERARGDGRR